MHRLAAGRAALLLAAAREGRVVGRCFLQLPLEGLEPVGAVGDGLDADTGNDDAIALEAVCFTFGQGISGGDRVRDGDFHAADALHVCGAEAGNVEVLRQLPIRHPRLDLEADGLAAALDLLALAIVLRPDRRCSDERQTAELLLAGLLLLHRERGDDERIGAAGFLRSFDEDLAAMHEVDDIRELSPLGVAVLELVARDLGIDIDAVGRGPFSADVGENLEGLAGALAGGAVASVEENGDLTVLVDGFIAGRFLFGRCGWHFSIGLDFLT